jgi:hypothetical protein
MLARRADETLGSRTQIALYVGELALADVGCVPKPLEACLGGATPHPNMRGIPALVCSSGQGSESPVRSPIRRFIAAVSIR